MVSSREVIELAVYVLDAVEEPNLPASEMFNAVIQASWPGAAPGDSPAVPARVQQPPAAQYDPLAAEVQPLIAALERHLQRVRIRRSASAGMHDLGDVGDPGLTVRETEALVLLSCGYTARATARRMGCATSTANKHLGNVYRKLGVADRLGAVLEAQRRGLLPADELEASPRGPAPIGPTRFAGGSRARVLSAQSSNR